MCRSFIATPETLSWGDLKNHGSSRIATTYYPRVAAASNHKCAPIECPLLIVLACPVPEERAVPTELRDAVARGRRGRPEAVRAIAREGDNAVDTVPGLHDRVDLNHQPDAGPMLCSLGHKAR